MLSTQPAGFWCLVLHRSLCTVRNDPQIQSQKEVLSPNQKRKGKYEGRPERQDRWKDTCLACGCDGHNLVQIPRHHIESNSFWSWTRCDPTPQDQELTFQNLLSQCVKSVWVGCLLPSHGKPALRSVYSHISRCSIQLMSPFRSEIIWEPCQNKIPLLSWSYSDRRPPIQPGFSIFLNRTGTCFSGS